MSLDDTSGWNESRGWTVRQKRSLLLVLLNWALTLFLSVAYGGRLGRFHLSGLCLISAVTPFRVPQNSSQIHISSHRACLHGDTQKGETGGAKIEIGVSAFPGRVHSFIAHSLCLFLHVALWVRILFSRAVQAGSLFKASCRVRWPLFPSYPCSNIAGCFPWKKTSKQLRLIKNGH